VHLREVLGKTLNNQSYELILPVAGEISNRVPPKCESDALQLYTNFRVAFT
jgi:hypothetical protein